MAAEVVVRYRERLAPKAVVLHTPAPDRVPLAKTCGPGAVREFVLAYEPMVGKTGLYAHQAEVLRAARSKQLPNVVMTTATGSGKSLAFWAWVVEALARDKNATAIACFPTQALLWGQAQRLARMSKSLCRHGSSHGSEEPPAYAGVLHFGAHRIPWTVWFGVKGNENMRLHEDCPSCMDARLRITTVDKAHWSLQGDKHAEFLRRLKAVVIDEAHVWHGLAGANVRGWINRLGIACELLGSPTPSFFLASATLAGAQEFAAGLTGLDGTTFLPVDDQGSIRLSVSTAADIRMDLLMPDPDPRRHVLAINADDEPVAAMDILGDEGIIGRDANAICFVQSKFRGHRMYSELERRCPHRKVVVYDADMVADERRRVEALFQQKDIRGMTVIATSALEVGVDLPGLDVAVMDELPPRRIDLVQRIGRVGRRADRPGLAILCLGFSPGDERLATDPEHVLAVDGAKPLPLPLSLESVRLRSTGAAFAEWAWRLKRGEVSEKALRSAIGRRFDWKTVPTQAQLNQIAETRLGGVEGDPQWCYKGFRASAAQGKKVLWLGGSNEAVAQVDDIAVFRDAHPEAVYLGHRGDRYRVVGYQGAFKVAEWSDPRSPVVLGKFMHVLSGIVVVPEKKRVATRGRWKDRYTLHEVRELPEGAQQPKVGAFEYGTWEFVRKFDGYLEIDLVGRKPARIVSLDDVADRFRAAIRAGEAFPFLHDFSYRTLGWQWNVVRVICDPERRKKAGPVVEGVLQTFFCQAVECAPGDLTVTLAPATGHLKVLDSTPGGSGLAEALLADDRAATALAEAHRVIAGYAKRPARFRTFLAGECHLETDLSREDVADVIGSLARAWPG